MTSRYDLALGRTQPKKASPDPNKNLTEEIAFLYEAYNQAIKGKRSIPLEEARATYIVDLKSMLTSGQISQEAYESIVRIITKSTVDQRQEQVNRLMGVTRRSTPSCGSSRSATPSCGSSRASLIGRRLHSTPSCGSSRRSAPSCGSSR